MLWRRLPVRDSQRARVYRADRDQWNLWEHPRRPASLTVAEMQEAATALARWVTQEWAAGRLDRRAWGHIRPWPVRVIAGPANQRAAWASPGHYSISVSTHPLIRSNTILAHELAHLFITPDEAVHGWQFCARYLVLVERLCGKDAARHLIDCFKANKVRYKAPRQNGRSRPLSPAEKAVLRERLAAARAAKRLVAAQP